MVSYPVGAAVAGFLTLGIEMVAGRVLAPYLGSSLHQWAALIGVVLLAYIGGYSFFRWITRRGAWVALCVAGAYVLLFPLWGFRVLEYFLDWPLALASIASALLVAGAPSLLWAALLPYFQARAGMGGSARVLAWGSAGNLGGAWASACVAVPGVGTRLPGRGLGALSWALALFLFLLERKQGGRGRGAVLRKPGVVAFLAVALGTTAWAGSDFFLPRASVGIEGLEAGSHLLLDRETAYQRVRVWEKEYDGRMFRALGLNQTVQFFWNSEEPWARGAPYLYYNWSALLAGLSANGTLPSGLFLGLGGGLVPWQIRHLFKTQGGAVPMPRMLALELDAGVAQAAKDLLPLGAAGSVEVKIGDARQLLRGLDEKFAYILADTFLNSYVPFHLTTQEFFVSARDHLAADGILVVNLHTVFRESGLLGKIETTLASVLPNAVAVDLPAGSTLLVASLGGQPLRARMDAAMGNPAFSVELRGEMGALLARVRGLEDLGAGGILTDDLNDTEQRLYETRRFLVLRRGI